MWALSQFASELVNPPCNLMWVFIFMHQLVYEAVAIKKPEECGFVVNAKPQTIETAVNKDLKSLLMARGDFTEKMSDSKLRNDLKSAKVRTSALDQ
jgi:hypothetical protein